MAHAKPMPPTNLSATKINDSTYIITWKAPANTTSLHGYNLYLNNQYKDTIIHSPNHEPSYSVSLNKSKTHTIELVTIIKENSMPVFSDKSSPLKITVVASKPKKKPVPIGLPDPIKNNYELVFFDEFNNTQLDTSLWNTNYIWGADIVTNNELQYYVDIKNKPNFGYNPFKLENGQLTMTAQKTPEKLKTAANGQKYLSGVLTSWDSFQTSHGYFEVRAKIPKGQGLWPAFWLLHVNQWNERPEIDIMENLGQDTQVIYNTYHYRTWVDGGWNEQRTPSMTVSEGIDYSKSFHTYSALWEPGLIIWYVDGVEKNRFKSNMISDEKMYILLNLAVGGNWPGSPGAQTKFPAEFKIDYVRAYKKK